MTKKTMMVDMDDVIYKDWFLNLLNTYLETNYKEEDFPSYYMQDILKAEEQNDFFKWMLTQNVYDYGVLVPYAYDVLKRLNYHFKLCIGTAYIFKELPLESGKLLLAQKYERLLGVFDFLKPHQIILVNDKSFIGTDIKVDDLVKNLSGAETKILFSSYHNLQIPNKELDKRDIIRTDDLLEVETVLQKRYLK